MNKEDVPVLKRVSAYMLDILIVFVLFSLISNIKFINPYYDKYLESYENYTETLEEFNEGNIEDNDLIKINQENYYYISKYSISYNIVIIVGLILYFGLFQKCCNGQTIGKKVMKIKIVDLDGKNPSFLKHVLRIIPMYYVYIGSLLPLIINSILVFIIGKGHYMLVSNIISYVFLTISLVSFIMINIRKDKRGLPDLFAKTKVVFE